MRRVLAATAIVAAVIAAVLFVARSHPGGPVATYKIELDNAFGLAEGGDLRIGGVQAGKTTKFSVLKRPGHAAKAIVTAEIDEPGLADLRSDARCEVRPQSLVGEYFVDCQPGSAQKRLPTDGSGTVPVEQTAGTIPLDLVQNVMRRPTRERLRLIVTGLGAGLAGRPADLQAVIKRAHPGLRETDRVLQMLGDQNRVIDNFIVNADTVVRELERNKVDVGRWVEKTADTSAIAASRRERLSAGIRKLPRFLDELRPTMSRLSAVSSEGVPLLTDLQQSAPQLDSLFTRLRPFAEASRPALRELGKASTEGTKAFREGSDEVAELRALSKDAPPFAKPLRQFLDSLDDRSRGLEDDQRAKNAAPPSPDPTAIKGSGPFTGFEALWNYSFWQTLSINQVDETGHIVRLGLTVDPDCSQFQSDPDQRVIDKCNQWLGPNQPGITTPDPTDRGGDGDRTKRRRTKRGDRRQDAAPTPQAPGTPQPGLPAPQLPQAPNVPAPNVPLPDPGDLPQAPVPQEQGGSGMQDLLDYLLGP
jgi:phospholipid/cholesterol/gamma-HCH transport system substrate-binding protein